MRAFGGAGSIRVRFPGVSAHLPVSPGAAGLHGWREILPALKIGHPAESKELPARAQGVAMACLIIAAK